MQLLILYTGQGCFGKLDIILAKEKSSMIVVVRQYDLESLQFSQLVEVQVYIQQQ